MRHFVWLWLAISSMGWAARVCAETRPQYGGTLHVAVHSTRASLNPADTSETASFAERNLLCLIFENLVSFDAGRLRPELADSWQSRGSNQWQFHLRRGIKLHDGSALSAEIAAASLRAANPAWHVTTQGEDVAIESDSPQEDLLQQLALPRNAIVRKSSDGTLIGTGAFRVVGWVPGKKLSLAANEDYWGGRPFLDAIEVELADNFREEQLAFEAGRVQMIEVPSEEMHRESAQASRITTSEPIELVALVFTRDAQSADESLLREALALSIERSSMRSVLLEGAGQLAASILPNWMSGYGFVFSTDADLAQARKDREQVQRLPAWTMSYDPSDAMARLLAERVALNARDAGITMQVTSGASGDIRVMRIPLIPNAQLSLANVARAAGLTKPDFGKSSMEDLYAAEVKMLSSRKVIPLFHLPVSFACAAEVHNCKVSESGMWDLADMWIETKNP
jgi:peptide/nickel transport system substrate-binding protein